MPVIPVDCEANLMNALALSLTYRPLYLQEEDHRESSSPPAWCSEHLYEPSPYLLVVFDLQHNLCVLCMSNTVFCIVWILVQSVQYFPCLLLLACPNEVAGCFFQLR